MDIASIDWSKVKKSPVPKDAGTGVVGWYRGSGIKIAVSYRDGMRIFDEAGSMLAYRKGDYDQMTTGEIKKMAGAVLAAMVMRAAKLEPVFVEQAEAEIKATAEIKPFRIKSKPKVVVSKSRMRSGMKGRKISGFAPRQRTRGSCRRVFA